VWQWALESALFTGWVHFLLDEDDCVCVCVCVCVALYQPPKGPSGMDYNDFTTIYSVLKLSILSLRDGVGNSGARDLCMNKLSILE